MQLFCGGEGDGGGVRSRMPAAATTLADFCRRVRWAQGRRCVVLMRRAVVEANCEQLSPPCPRASLPLPSTGACVNPTISGSLPLFILVPTQDLISVQAPGAQVCRCSTAVLDR